MQPLKTERFGTGTFLWINRGVLIRVTDLFLPERSPNTFAFNAIESACREDRNGRDDFVSWMEYMAVVHKTMYVTIDEGVFYEVRRQLPVARETSTYGFGSFIITDRWRSYDLRDNHFIATLIARKSRLDQ